jgi:hypothetical protein
MNLVFVAIVATFVSLTACESKFIRPPQWDPNQGANRDLGKNIRYSDSENIAIIFDSDEPKTDLYVWQMDPTNKKGGQHALLESMTNSPLQPFESILIWACRR